MFDCCFFSGWVWRILYGIYYEGKLIDSRTLPSIDIALCCYFSGWVWRILYGIYYEGKLIDSRTLPSIDMAYLQSRLYSGVPVNFLTSINYYSDRSFSLYVQDKVSWLNYGNYEWALKQTWLQTYQSSELFHNLDLSLK